MAVSGAVSVPVINTAYGHIGTEDSSLKRGRAEGQTTEAVVRTYFSDIPIMIQIARCESRFRHTLSDGTVLRGIVNPHDTGVMQINTRYHEKKAKSLGLDLTHLEDNLAYARMLYEEQGTRPWNASAPCWDKTAKAE